ncbi:M13 family metallopeptidase [Roseiterribacter gracilis]|uniref:Metallopeptidase n=1 Tax=Roseiterribacter gracilis TaxID=2812848 RepID=A0A8S8XIB2_9PROT|nr:metallopeptidase [Rhodospirillales bacterium TMPK1]
MNRPLILALPLLAVGSFAFAADAPRMSLDPKNLDRSVSACTDFFQFATGGKKYEIPPAESRWGSFDELAERNQVAVRGVLDKLAAKPSSDVEERKVGAFYGACMNEAKVEADGIAPLKPRLVAIDAVKNRAGFEAEFAKLQAGGVPTLFNFFSSQDQKNPDRVIGSISQGGLSLPNKDYYTKTDEKTVALRAAFTQYVDKMFELMGDKTPSPGATVLAFETKLAGGSRTPVELRNPNANYNPHKLADLKTLAPGFNWDRYIASLGVQLDGVNVGQPEFVKNADALLGSEPLATLKTYAKWRLMQTTVSSMPKRFIDTAFAFDSKMTGAKEQQPRWKRCVAATTAAMPDAVGKVFVKEVIDPRTKTRVEGMLVNIRAALSETLQQLDWMTPATKARALAKADAVMQLVAWPDKPRDYTNLKIEAGTPFAVDQAAVRSFEVARNRAKIGKPPARDEWTFAASIVNAQYSPLYNRILFPAGILQPPFFDANADDAVNYGGIGAVIGHELTHGFDDQGRQFDAKGILQDWWEPSDADNYKKRAQCVVDQFESYVGIDDVHHQGRLVQGEAIADLGGLTISYRAFQKTDEAKAKKEIDGLTPDQRFFLSFGQIWAGAIRPEAIRTRLATDPHPLGKFRTIGTVSNMSEFATAFACKPGDAMVRATACKIW